MLIIIAFRRLRQDREFENSLALDKVQTSLGYIARPYLRKK
jgi:hypothetical protein